MSKSATADFDWRWGPAVRDARRGDPAPAQGNESQGNARQFKQALNGALMPDIILVERNPVAFHETAMFSHEGTDMWRKRQRRAPT
jgi:hypothetical protein